MLTANDDTAAACRYHHPTRRADLRERRRQEQRLAEAMNAELLAIATTPRVTLFGCAHVADEIAPRWLQARSGAATAAATAATTGDAALARSITTWLLRAACTSGADRSRIASVLLPDALPRDAQLVEDVARIVRASARAPGQLELRMSEAALHTISTEALLCLSGLRDLDIRLAIDDFGRRIGSLGALRHLPLAAIRLDPCLTHDVLSDTTDRMLVENLVAMAQGLNIDVIALAVDSPDQRNLLRRLGVAEGIGRLAFPGSELPAAA